MAKLRASGRGLEWTACHWRVARQHAAPIDIAVARPEVRQSKAIAGGLGRRFSAAHLAQVPVVELVQVEEAQHLTPRPESDRLAEPLEGEAPAGLAAGPHVHFFVSGAKGFWNLEFEQPVLVPA